MYKLIAIIPARGGSRRIPNKNIRNFCVKPIISHIWKTAYESKFFNKIYVSTDFNQIAKIVSDIGFFPDFKRPKEFNLR